MFFRHQEQHRKAYLESLALGLVEPPVFFLALLAWVKIMKDTNDGKRPRKVKEHRSNLPNDIQCRGWRGSPCKRCTLSSLCRRPIVSGKWWHWWSIRSKHCTLSSLCLHGGSNRLFLGNHGNDGQSLLWSIMSNHCFWESLGPDTQLWWHFYRWSYDKKLIRRSNQSCISQNR